MAETTESSPDSFSLTSYQTALCVIPPRDRWDSINRLRSLYDHAYGRWDPHVNILYPFVPVPKLDAALERIRAELASRNSNSEFGLVLRLDDADYFSQRQGKTIHLAPRHSDDAADASTTDTANEQWQFLRDCSLRALGQHRRQQQANTEREFQPHLTVGQTKSHDREARDYLLAKARLLLPLEWRATELVVLVREHAGPTGQDRSGSKMVLYATIDLDGGKVTMADEKVTTDPIAEESSAFEKMGISSPTNELTFGMGSAQPRCTYVFDTEHDVWKPVTKTSTKFEGEDVMPRTFAVSSYNLLVEHGTHDQARYSTLLRNILSESAAADVLVLQEVCDDFLSHLLSDAEIRDRYPYATHGPPSQEGVGPLPSLRNIVVLSQWDFTWKWVPFEARHKGVVVLTMDTIGKYDVCDAFIPVVVAAVHLTSGLTDHAVATKKLQLQGLLSHLSAEYPDNPCIIAGDFNITTSQFSIDKALSQQRISTQTHRTQLELEALLSESWLSDAWQVAHSGLAGAVDLSRDVSDSDHLYEGEQGATFNPAINPLALESAKTGFARPQRYDRILAKEQGLLSVARFNMFGFPDEVGPISGLDDEPAEQKFGSDHWGIRASFRIRDDDDEDANRDYDKLEAAASLELHKAPECLASTEALKEWLAEKGMVPSQEEAQKRKEVFDLIKSLIVHGSIPEEDDYQSEISQTLVSFVVVPVGSYGLGVWNSSSDVDCLCVGSISSRTFFALATQRLSKAAPLGVRVLRKVKAASGIMLEIDVRDIRFDIHYCPAARVAERWREVPQLPPTDPLFDLPLNSLTKLQPFLDQKNIQRTVPDLAAFRTAHRFLRSWAKQRGIYAAKFGYLAGIHLTMMLSRVSKLLFRNAGTITAADIVCTFFRHYADFDWDHEILYDPIFFKGKKPKYRRFVNEPMVILTLFPPVINVTRAVSVPSGRTIVEELKRASELLEQPDMTWSTLSGGTAADEFLKSYNSYVKVTVRYWGISLSKGSALLGWLESRCLRLLVDLDRKLPGIHTRIWPALFTSKDNEATSLEEGEYQGCYLIGLARRDAAEVETMSKDDRKKAQDALQAALVRFTAQIQGEDKYFDPSLAWIDGTHVKQSDLADLTIDTREWGDYVVPEEEDSDSDAEEEEDENIVDPEAEAAMAATSTAGMSQKLKKAAAKASRTSQRPKGAGKLRPATDVLNRLRWDPSHDAADYLIGYEDRFLGTKEMPLEHWKGEQTDEEFIPLHRIVYFRRRADGEIVWDRRTRKDVIFASGAGKGD